MMNNTIELSRTQEQSDSYSEKLLAYIALPSQAIIAGLAISLLFILGMFYTIALYLGLGVLGLVCCIRFFSIYKEVSSLDFTDLDTELSWEDIINDLENR